MEERIRKEVAMLEKKYGTVELGPNSAWVLIKDYQLPPGWNRSETYILILITAGYPSTKPDNFYVPKGLRAAEPSITIQNYNENGHNHLGKEWGQFSFHMEEWSPSDDIVSGHNLLTFMIGIEQRLSQVN